MIHPDFLDSESRCDLIELVRDGSAAHRLAQRANALVLLHDGLSYASIAKVLFLDDDTVRTRYQMYQEDGVEGLANFSHERGIGRLTVDALITIMLLMAIEATSPGRRSIHVFLGKARYRRVQSNQAWLARPGYRIEPHFAPAYCPQLHPIERLWGLMHRHLANNKCYATFKDFGIAMLNLLRDGVPRNRRAYCADVTDSFRIIKTTSFRIIA